MCIDTYLYFCKKANWLNVTYLCLYIWVVVIAVGLFLLPVVVSGIRKESTHRTNQMSSRSNQVTITGYIERSGCVINISLQRNILISAIVFDKKVIYVCTRRTLWVKDICDTPSTSISPLTPAIQLEEAEWKLITILVQ